MAVSLSFLVCVWFGLEQRSAYFGLIRGPVCGGFPYKTKKPVFTEYTDFYLYILVSGYGYKAWLPSTLEGC